MAERPKKLPKNSLRRQSWNQPRHRSNSSYESSGEEVELWSNSSEDEDESHKIETENNEFSKDHRSRHSFSTSSLGEAVDSKHFSKSQKLDLQIFEHHIKTTFIYLKKQQFYYEMILLGLVLFNLFCLWKAYFTTVKFETYGNTLVALSFGMILFFFISGLYTNKIKAPETYIRRMNSSLQYFQVRFSVNRFKLVKLKLNYHSQAHWTDFLQQQQQQYVANNLRIYKRPSFSSTPSTPSFSSGLSSLVTQYTSATPATSFPAQRNIQSKHNSSSSQLLQQEHDEQIHELKLK